MSNEHNSPELDTLEDQYGDIDTQSNELSMGDTFEIDGERFIVLYVIGDHKASEERYVTYMKGYNSVTHTTPLSVLSEQATVVTRFRDMVPFGVSIAVTPEDQHLGEIFERVMLQTMRINVDRFTAFDIRDEAVNVINDPATADNAVGYWNNAQSEIVQDDNVNNGSPYILVTLWGIVDPEKLENPDEFRQARDISYHYNTALSHVEKLNSADEFVVTPEMSINLVPKIADGEFSDEQLDRSGDQEVTH